MTWHCAVKTGIESCDGIWTFQFRDENYIAVFHFSVITSLFLKCYLWYECKVHYCLWLLQLFCCSSSFKRSGKPTAFVPLIPFTFVVGYQADLAHGNKMERIRGWCYKCALLCGVLKNSCKHTPILPQNLFIMNFYKIMTIAWLVVLCLWIFFRTAAFQAKLINDMNVNVIYQFF